MGRIHTAWQIFYTLDKGGLQERIFAWRHTEQEVAEFVAWLANDPDRHLEEVLQEEVEDSSGT